MVTVIWDCDGVIFDTNSRKVDVFRATLERLSDPNVDAKVAHVEAHPHKTRFKLFREWYPDRVDACVTLFSEECEIMYQNTRPELGALAVAAKHQSVVVSNSCQAQLERAFRHHGICPAPFQRVLGTPTTKEEHIKSMNQPFAAFVGDGKLDWEVAKAHHIPFIYIGFINSAWKQGREVCAACPNSRVACSWDDVDAMLGSMLPAAK